MNYEIVEDRVRDKIWDRDRDRFWRRVWVGVRRGVCNIVVAHSSSSEVNNEL